MAEDRMQSTTTARSLQLWRDGSNKIFPSNCTSEWERVAYITPELMAKPLSCITTTVRMREYHQQLSKLLFEGEKGILAFKYFSETLMGKVIDTDIRGPGIKTTRLFDDGKER